MFTEGHKRQRVKSLADNEYGINRRNNLFTRKLRAQCPLDLGMAIYLMTVGGHAERILKGYRSS